MSNTSNHHYYSRSLIPFTGIVFAVWAFFEPEKYGAWLGSIVKAFRSAANL